MKRIVLAAFLGFGAFHGMAFGLLSLSHHHDRKTHTCECPTEPVFESPPVCPER